MSKYRAIILIFFIIVIWRTIYYFSQPKSFQLDEPQYSIKNDSYKPILVTVYYEALCSDSRNFIIKQLVPTYAKLSPLISLDLVPYGKASTFVEGDSYLFECQHSHIECEANKIHACALHHLLSPSVYLKYIACMIQDNIMPHDVGERCADELDIDYSPIRHCANGQHGSKLLKEYGDRTHYVSPKITFIPTIQLNKSSKVPLVLILKDLFKEVCNLFETPKPSQCL